MRARQLSRWTAGLVAVATVGTTTACGNPPTTAGTTSTDRSRPVGNERVAEEKAAEEAALKAYAGYLTASRSASRHSDPQHPELTRFLADPLLTRVRVGLIKARANGAVSTGTLRSDPTVISVDLDGKPPTVEIQDCLDATGYRLVYVADKKVVPGTRGTRHLATAIATRYPDGRWLISGGSAHRDQPC
ncbi:hypothetical protein JMF97_11950 [Micromonospora fiedleri]|uniref:Uncharacterized protein n=1 Tax=Micromonospora fiedleri TaxID=1157498 RepID=A0ABS1UKL0_9ACTN|nr:MULTISPECIES: hypothetical protein [Micromonospora]MBL6276875.1 hypothetical protein [Micromonospora fiedleri]WSK43412.1 hypothetical protein OG712_04425 [Micromonospora maris]